MTRELSVVRVFVEAIDVAEQSVGMGVPLGTGKWAAFFSPLRWPGGGFLHESPLFYHPRTERTDGMGPDLSGDFLVTFW